MRDVRTKLGLILAGAMVSQSAFAATRTVQFVGTVINHSERLVLGNYPSFTACNIVVVNTGNTPQKVTSLKFYGFTSDNPKDPSEIPYLHTTPVAIVAEGVFQSRAKGSSGADVNKPITLASAFGHQQRRRLFSSLRPTWNLPTSPVRRSICAQACLKCKTPTQPNQAQSLLSDRSPTSKKWRSPVVNSTARFISAART